MQRKDDIEYEIDDLRIMAEATNYQKWVLEKITPFIGNRILEVGAGIGNYTRYLLNREHVHVVELNARSLELLRNQFTGNSNIDFYCMDATDGKILQFKNKRIDTIICLNVMEHIADDVLLLNSFHEILQPGGHVVLQVPALTALYGELDRKLGHHRRYTKKTIRQKLAETKFEVKELYYFNLIGSLGWFYMTRVKRQPSQDRRQVRFFDKVIVPIVSPIEKFIKVPFGQSLIVVLRK